MKQKMLKELIVFKCWLLCFNLDFAPVEFLAGMYLILKKYFWKRNSYVPELCINYISFKSKSKYYVNIWDRMNITKWKLKGSVLMSQELLNLE